MREIYLIFLGDKYDKNNSAQKGKNKVSDRLHWETWRESSSLRNNLQIFRQLKIEFFLGCKLICLYKVESKFQYFQI